MSESYFEVLRDGLPSKRHAIRINGRQPTFRIEMDKISAQLVTPLTSELKDLMEIASAVFLADTTVRRGGDTRPDFGSRWHRHLQFRLYVRHPDIWSRPDVHDALRDAVEFLTGDRVEFTFAAGEPDPPTGEYLPFDESAELFPADEVILFSGGLDSFAGALEALKTRYGKVILVTHRSAPKAITRQVNLGRFLKAEFGGRILHLHIKATRSRQASSDSTQRSRSLLFATLGHVVARMAGAKRISFYENGVVSHNLPISPQVSGTMASRTTHPLSLKKLQTLFDRIGEGKTCPIVNPFEWLTKKDVLEKIRDHGGCDAVKETVSCTNLRNESRETHHCGTCSQCLDRRFAIIAANLEAHDRSTDYKIDVLTGPRGSDRQRIMAIEWTRHASRLADMDIMEFGERFASDLVRIASAYPDVEITRVIERALDLQKRHAATVHRVMDKAVEAHGTLLNRRKLPTSCLLSMYLHDVTGGMPPIEDGLKVRLAMPDDALREPSPTPDSSIFPLRVAFYGSPPSFVIEVEWLGCVRHEPAGVAHDLKPQFEEDLAAGLAPENFRYVPIEVLASARRTVSANTVVQHVRRCRAQLAELYEAIEQRPPDHDLLIENRRYFGYRLDPTIRIIDRSQLRSRR